MAKLALINREEKRRKTVERFAVKRAGLQHVLNDSSLSDEERFEARLKFQALPRGVYRKFGLGRSKLRDFVMRGEVPGMTKASW